MRYSPATQITPENTARPEVMQKKLIVEPISNHDPDEGASGSMHNFVSREKITCVANFEEERHCHD